MIATNFFFIIFLSPFVLLVRLVYKNISGITIEYFSINIKNFTVFRHVDENFLVFIFSLRHIVQLQQKRAFRFVPITSFAPSLTNIPIPLFLYQNSCIHKYIYALCRCRRIYRIQLCKLVCARHALILKKHIPQYGRFLSFRLSEYRLISPDSEFHSHAPPPFLYK